MTETCLVIHATARRYTGKDGTARAYATIVYAMPPGPTEPGTHGLPIAESRVPIELAEHVGPSLPALCDLAFAARSYQGRSELTVTGASVTRKVELASVWQTPKA